MAPASALPTWLADALGSLTAGDVDGWLGTFTPDAVHEFPFAAQDYVRRLEGREEMAACMSRDGRVTSLRDYMNPLQHAAH